MAWIEPPVGPSGNSSPWRASVSSSSPSPRTYHSLTWVPELHQAVLIGGTQGDQLLADVHVFSYTGDQGWHWKEMDVKLSGTRNALTPRARHSAITIDGKIYVFGGIGGGEAVFSLDLHKKRWIRLKTTGRGPCARFAHIAASIHDDMIIAGGHTGDHFVMDVFRFQTQTRKWSQLTIKPSANLPPSLHYVGCTVGDSEIIVLGGSIGAEIDHAYVLRQPKVAETAPQGSQRHLSFASMHRGGTSSTRLMHPNMSMREQIMHNSSSSRAYKWVKVHLDGARQVGERYPKIGYGQALVSRLISTARVALGSEQQQLVFLAGAVLPPSQCPVSNPFESPLTSIWTLRISITGSGNMKTGRQRGLHEANSLQWSVQHTLGQIPPVRIGTSCVTITNSSLQSGLLIFGGTLAPTQPVSKYTDPNPLPSPNKYSSLAFDTSNTNRENQADNDRNFGRYFTCTTHICDLSAYAIWRSLTDTLSVKQSQSWYGHALVSLGSSPENPHLEQVFMFGGQTMHEGLAILVRNVRTNLWSWQTPPRSTLKELRDAQNDTGSSFFSNSKPSTLVVATQTRSLSSKDGAALIFAFGGNRINLQTIGDTLWVVACSSLTDYQSSWVSASPKEVVHDTAASDEGSLPCQVICASEGWLCGDDAWPRARRGHTVCMHRDNLFVIGGLSQDGELLGDVWSLRTDGTLYNPSLSSEKQVDVENIRWKCHTAQGADGSYVQEVFTPRVGHSCVSVNSLNKVFVFGGCSATNVPRIGSSSKAATRNADWDAPNVSSKSLSNDLFVLDCNNKKPEWHRLDTCSSGRPPSPRYLHTCTVMSDHTSTGAFARPRLCVVGGWGLSRSAMELNLGPSQPQVQNDVFLYDIATQTWSDLRLQTSPECPLKFPALINLRSCTLSTPSEVLIFGGALNIRTVNSSAKESQSATDDPLVHAVVTKNETASKTSFQVAPTELFSTATNSQFIHIDTRMRSLLLGEHV